MRFLRVTHTRLHGQPAPLLPLRLINLLFPLGRWIFFFVIRREHKSIQLFDSLRRKSRVSLHTPDCVVWIFTIRRACRGEISTSWPVVGETSYLCVWFYGSDRTVDRGEIVVQVKDPPPSTISVPVWSAGEFMLWRGFEWVIWRVEELCNKMPIFMSRGEFLFANVVKMFRFFLGLSTGGGEM